MNTTTQSTDTSGDTLRRALRLHEEGRLTEAETLYRTLVEEHHDHADALSLLGVVRAQMGDPEDGVAWLWKAVRAAPRQPVILNNLGLALIRAGRQEEACEALEESIRYAPDLAEAWLNLGNARRDLGLRTEAMTAYRGSIRRDPSLAEAHHNLGCLLLEESRLDAAAEAFRTVVGLEPDHVDAYTNLGVARYRDGRLDEAEEAFRAALAQDGSDASARNNLGMVLRDKGDALGALQALWELVRADTTDEQSWIAFAEVFRGVTFDPRDASGDLQNVLLACLLQDGLDHQRLAPQGVRLLRADAALLPLLALAVGDDDETLDAAVDAPEAVAALTRPVVRLVLQRVVLPDPAFERLFMAARRTQLRRVAENPDRAEIDLVASLARQCFHNGYVWDFGEREVAQVEGLVATMAGRPLGSDPGDRARVAALACYVPLLEWERAREVVDLAESDEDPALPGLVRQQIAEPFQESLLQEVIPTRGSIDNEVSVAVREQYEEHPYPRWISVDRRRPAPVMEVLQEILPPEALAGIRPPASPRILVAGCGTGKHMVDAALRFQDAEVVALDLSRGSLAYALRKASELGLDDISLLQADILALVDWENRFDIIECGGVLHHMEDPVAGWRVLAALLRPGGLMHIGLYSDIGRRDVVRARELIARGGYPATPEGIRAARPELARHFAVAGSPLLRWRDFYSMEECRDLLFHVQEHRFTLPRVAEILDELGLEFLGFEFTGPVQTRRFRARFPEAGAELSLEAWHTFETENPDAFAGMYQFWVKGASRGR